MAAHGEVKPVFVPDVVDVEQDEFSDCHGRCMEPPTRVLLFALHRDGIIDTAAAHAG